MVALKGLPTCQLAATLRTFDRRLAWALTTIVVHYLTTIRPQARRELARWREQAEAIPDPVLRAHVLRPFDADLSTEGAALFAVLAPRRRQRQLVPLLVAYVLLWSYVDVRTERDQDADPRLLDALLDALRTDATAMPEDDYLASLVAESQRRCSTLPSWDAVQPLALCHARDGRDVQAINHGQRPLAEQRLRAWAARRPHWRERCAAASSPLPIHALMALAANPLATAHDVTATAAAYQPVSALAVLCDHFIDEAEDDRLTNHTYLRYYANSTERMQGLHALADTARRRVRTLPDGNRHTIILAAMTAMFLSGEKAWTDENAGISRAMLHALGQPTQILLTLLCRKRLSSSRSAV